MKRFSVNTYKFVHLASYLTIFHGVVYYVVKYFLKTETEYGIRPNDYQSIIQGAHIVLSPFLIFALGILWKSHILKFFKKKTRKLYSGTILTLSLILISFSGYLIQVIYRPTEKEISIYIHLIFSGLYIGSYIFHHFHKRLTRK